MSPGGGRRRAVIVSVDAFAEDFAVADAPFESGEDAQVEGGLVEPDWAHDTIVRRLQAESVDRLADLEGPVTGGTMWRSPSCRSSC